jgi:hypothetical protein
VYELDTPHLLPAVAVCQFRVSDAPGPFSDWFCALTPDRRHLVITESQTGTILIAEIPPS